MNWLVCNNCLRRPVNGVKTFNVTSCLHLLCDGCINPDCTECTKCKQKCVVIELNSRTPAKVKRLFSEVSPERVVSLKRIMDIQRMHRLSIVSSHRDLFKKCKLLKNALGTYEKNANILWHKYQDSKVKMLNIQAENSALKRKLQAFEQQQAAAYHSTPTALPPPKNYSPSNIYSHIATPRRMPINMNSSVFVTPDSVATSTSESSGDGSKNSFYWGGKNLSLVDVTAFTTPNPRLYQHP